MGLLDKARNTLSNLGGDEVIRKGDFGSIDGEDEVAPEKTTKEPKPSRAKKVRQPKAPRAKKKSPDESPRKLESTLGKTRRLAKKMESRSADGEDALEEPEDSRVYHQSQKGSQDDDSFNSAGGAFEESFHDVEKAEATQGSSWGSRRSKENRAQSDVAPVDQEQLSSLSRDEGQSPQEILKSMNIQETFIIGEDILFLDEELRNKKFSTQAPYGYDMGEVDYFQVKTQRSVAEYVRLLRQRNEDIFRLASRLSDLMVKNNNLRFNAEVANGINIMAGSGDDDALAVELDESRLLVGKLKEEIKRLTEGGATAADNSSELEELRSELSLERRRAAAAEAEAQDLKAHLLLIEEEYDIEIFSDQGDLKSSANGNSYEQSYESFGRTDADRAEQELYAEEANYQSMGRDHWLPTTEAGTELPLMDEELPNVEEDYSEDDQPLEDFAIDDESLGDFSTENGADESFVQTDEVFANSAFSPDPYQSLDEFMEENQDAFPEDGSVGGSASDYDEDPDEDGFRYSFERSI